MRRTLRIFPLLSLLALFPATAHASSVYVVNAGDTLYKIAQEHQTTVSELMQINQLSSDLLSIGQTLILPPPAQANETAAPAAASAPQVVAASMPDEAEQLQDAKKARVIADVLNVRANPSLDADIVGKLYYGSVVKVKEAGATWTKIRFDKEDAYVATEFLEAVLPSSNKDAQSADQQFEELEKIFEPLLHTPYVVGGTTPDGFDCSGFTRYVYGKLGITLPRTSAEQFLGGESVPFEEARPGDLLFYDTMGTGHVSHVAIYLGGDLIVHATGEEVDYGRVSYMDKLYPFYGVKRYLQD